MPKYILTYLVIILTQTAFGQTKKENNKQEIQNVINTFKQCLIQKDSLKFYNLFHIEPVVWVGITHQKSYTEELKKDTAAKDYYSSSYQSFYRYFYDKQIEEKFYNIQILENGYIATVMFDYSFWVKGTKTNWGKESWAMIKTNGVWKITSIIFSSEDEVINPEPKNKKNNRSIEK